VLTGMTASQARFPIAPSIYKFSQQGKAGHWISELFPWTGKVADELCVIKSLHTEAINHDPGVTMMQTGTTQAGRPALGAWLSYGLGSENDQLPAFVVLTSGHGQDQPLLTRYWGNGFLFQGSGHYRSGIIAYP